MQVAFDIPVSGPNGLGGVTVSGSTSDYRQSVDKKGNIRVSMNVIGTGISAQVYINLPNGSNQASVDISSKNMNPPKYPPAAARAGIQGTVILIIDVDANGNVTNVSVEKSSRNRDLDRAAMDAARKWRFNPGQSNGQRSAGRVRVPVDFKM